MSPLAITFDAGGTLITPWPSVGHIYSEVAAAHGFPAISPELLNANFAVAWRTFPQFSHLRSEWESLVVRCFAGHLGHEDVLRFFPALYDRFTEPDAWHIFDDVLPTFDSLRSRGLRLAVLSNWDDRLRPLLHKLGLADWFQAIVVSCEIGVAKPGLRIFQAASRALGLPPAQILHVGDSPEADLEGAKHANFQALLLNRRCKEPQGVEIPSLATVPGLLSTPRP